jgi:hypothetical protein
MTQTAGQGLAPGPGRSARSRIFGLATAGAGACLLLAKLGERLLLGRKVGDGRAWELGHGGLKRIAFPLLALLLVLGARRWRNSGCTSACFRWRCRCWPRWQ